MLLKIFSLALVICVHLHESNSLFTGKGFKEITGFQSDSTIEGVNRTGKFIIFTQTRPGANGQICLGKGSKSMGVCKSTALCTKEGGVDVGIGNCAENTGTCCITTVKAKQSPDDVMTIKQTAVTLVASGVANSRSTFDFPKQQDVCQLKVLFLDTKLENPTSDPIQGGNCGNDAITVSGSTTLGPDGIVVCGDLSNQHMYLSYDKNEQAPSIRMVIKTKSRSAKYAINVIQIKCGTPEIAKEGCLQEFVGDSGQVKSFGFPYQLNNQNYKICTVADQTGAKSVSWKECISQSQRKPFFITGVETAPGSPVPAQSGNVLCSSDYIDFPAQTPLSRFCGGSFATITVPSGNGLIDVHFDRDEIGHSVVVTNLPPSLSCSAIEFPAHNCQVHGTGTEPCICTLDPVFPIKVNIPVLEAEACPTISGYESMKTTTTSCDYVQLYDEADYLNTGFCLQFTHNF